MSLGLANEDGFPHRGTINFVDNQVNPKTGTLRVRGVFPNKDEALSPGFFARVRVPIGQPHQALLVTDRALDTDQGQKIVYVVNDKNEVVSRPVRLGALHDGLREITDGLKPGERVIVNGLQQVRPGVTVEPKLVDMPTSRVRDRNGTGAHGEAPRPDPATRNPDRRPPRRRTVMLARFFIDRPVLAWVHLDRHRPARRHRRGPPAGRRVSGDHAADRPGDGQLPRGQRPGGGRHGGRADRAAGQRRREACCTCRRRATTTARTPWT